MALRLVRRREGKPGRGRVLKRWGRAVRSLYVLPAGSPRLRVNGVVMASAELLVRARWSWARLAADRPARRPPRRAATGRDSRASTARPAGPGDLHRPAGGHLTGRPDPPGTVGRPADLDRGCRGGGATADAAGRRAGRDARSGGRGCRRRARLHRRVTVAGSRRPRLPRPRKPWWGRPAASGRATDSRPPVPGRMCTASRSSPDRSSALLPRHHEAPTAGPGWVSDGHPAQPPRTPPQGRPGPPARRARTPPGWPRPPTSPSAVQPRSWDPRGGAGRYRSRGSGAVSRWQDPRHRVDTHCSVSVRRTSAARGTGCRIRW
ncbi:hypothetical protein SCANM63S_10036 [Streptomyces canarius]